MSKLKLYHGNVFIGTISNIVPEDSYEMCGDIELSSEFENYQPIFSYLLANDGLTTGKEQSFDDNYFEGWYLKDESGIEKAIDIPAIENNEIIWRE